MSRIILGRLAAGFGLAMTIALLGACSDNGGSSKAQSGAIRSSGKAAIGGTYTLVDHTGKTVTDKDYRGKAQLIYFGYAYCPDVCPTALQQMGAALELIGNDAEDFQPIFITIDPQRDTPEKLAQYVTANGFPDGLIGLSGSQEQINHVMKIFKVHGKKVDDPNSAADYIMDHTSIIYLMDKNGEFVAPFTHSSTPRSIADHLLAYKKTGL